MSFLSILEWIIWSIALLGGLWFAFGIRQTAVHRGPPPTWPTLILALALVAFPTMFLFFPFNKLHILWLLVLIWPLSLIAGVGYIPLVSQLLIWPAYFYALIIMAGTGVSISSPARQSPWSARRLNDFPESDPWQHVRDLIDEDRYPDALTAVEEQIQRMPADEQGYLLKGGIMQLMSRFDDAATFYEQTITTFPNCSKAYVSLIDLLSLSFRSRTEENAKQIISLCVRLEEIDSNAVPYDVQANSYHELGEYTAALGSYNEAIARLEQRQDACRKIVADPERRPDIRKIAEFECHGAQKKLHDAHCGKAQVLERLDKLEEAIKSYLEAIAVNRAADQEEDSYSDYEAIAYLHEAIGNEAESKRHFERARELEKAFDDQMERDLYGCTENEFNQWYEKHVELNEDGIIKRIRKDAESN